MFILTQIICNRTPVPVTKNKIPMPVTKNKPSIFFLIKQDSKNIHIISVIKRYLNKSLELFLPSSFFLVEADDLKGQQNWMNKMENGS